jgi:hypothetical protein
MIHEFTTWLGAQPQAVATFLGTVTGSAIGFLTLILGALFNAYLNRRRDDSLRDFDRTSLAIAFHTELAGIHTSLIDNVEALRKRPPSNPGGFLMPSPHRIMLQAMHDKLGLLRPECVSAILKAYILVDQIRDALIVLGGTHPEGFPDDREIFYMDGSQADFVAQMLEVKAVPVQEAMQLLSPYLR